MATIWAWRPDAGNWAANNPETTGWSHQIVFNGLADRLRYRVRGLGNPHVARKVRVLPHAQLTKLIGSDRHEGVVGAWNDQTFPRKCANPNCPGHRESTEFCEPFANQFPNGPLK